MYYRIPQPEDSNNLKHWIDKLERNEGEYNQRLYIELCRPGLTLAIFDWCPTDPVYVRRALSLLQDLKLQYGTEIRLRYTRRLPTGRLVPVWAAFPLIEVKDDKE